MSLPDYSEPKQPRLMEDVLASLSEAVAVERGDRVVFVNAAFTRIFGYMEEDIRGGRLRDFIVPESHWKRSGCKAFASSS